MFIVMFIVPLSLFLITTYLRPRTKAELSYLIATIECLSGLWCLLFAPVQIQLSLAGLLLLRNTGRLKSLIDKTQSQKDSYLDLSDASNPAIDVEAVPMLHWLNSASQLETPYPLRFQDQTRSPIQTSCAIAVFQPKLPNTSLQPDNSPPPNIPIILPTQRVQMRYRGTTYFKSIPTRGEE
jgi:hypothetical protein